MSTSIDGRVYACLDRMYCTCTCPFSSQSLLKKHDAFESDLEVHRARVGETEDEGQGLISNVRPARNLILTH